MDNSRCGILLKELRLNPEIQIYLRKILEKPIQNLENEYSKLKINFEFEEILFNKNKIISYNNEQNMIKDFEQKYLKNIDDNSLMELIKEYKDNKNMSDYLFSKKSDINDNLDLISYGNNCNLLIKCNDIFNIYQYYFMIVINFIDEIINNILDNIYSIPYIIKCLCKIIAELIHNTFPSINVHETSIFINKFFFGKIILPIFQNPNFELYMSNYISEKTLNNLKVIQMIFTKFTSGLFFTSKKDEYNSYNSLLYSFNWFFIYRMPKLFDIFEKLTNVQLTPLIERKLNDNKFPSNYEYNYFKENPDEIINCNSIFFNLEQISVLAETIKNNKDILKNEKLKDLLKYFENEHNIEILNSEKIDNPEKENKINNNNLNNINIDEKEQNSLIHYFLITSLEKNSQYEKLFNIESKINFSINESPNATAEVKNIIKVKNLLSGLLYNMEQLEIINFEKEKIDTTEKILNELNNLLQSEDYEENDESISPLWYLKSLLDNIKKLPKDYSKNDYEKLYDEFEQDIKKSIKDLDLEALNFILEKIKLTKTKINYNEKLVQNLNNFQINQKINKIVNELIVPVDILFNIKKEMLQDDFAIKESKLNERNFDNKKKIENYEKSNNIFFCKTIRNFIDKFPNLQKYQLNYDKDIFEVQKKLNFPQKILEYMNIIKSKLKNGKKLELIMDKLNDYIMTNLYDKIFTIQPDKKDAEIYKKSIYLSWVQLKHFIDSDKELLIGDFINDISKSFNKLEEEKSLKGKIFYLNKSFDLLKKLQKFNRQENNLGFQGQIPIMEYAFIKGQKTMLYSNIIFMKLYLKEEEIKKIQDKLELLNVLSDLILKLGYTDLKGVTKEEYEYECNKVYKIYN